MSSNLKVPLSAITARTTHVRVWILKFSCSGWNCWQIYLNIVHLIQPDNSTSVVTKIIWWYDEHVKRKAPLLWAIKSRLTCSVLERCTHIRIRQVHSHGPDCHEWGIFSGLLCPFYCLAKAVPSLREEDLLIVCACLCICLVCHLIMTWVDRSLLNGPLVGLL